jgi:MoaA/NifB/PqqE/SkfB family radical SAM enzyme
VVKLAEQKWGLKLMGLNCKQAIHVRVPTRFHYENASWELDLRCDYDCEHCYLGRKPADTLEMHDRIKILDTMSNLGVYRLQITGGEPLIDRYFKESYLAAYSRGMLIRVSTNASQLYREHIIQLFANYPPLHLAVSMYGSTAESYEALTRTPPGTFERFMLGLKAAAEAGIKMRINIIVTRYNEHQVTEMEKLAETVGAEYFVYTRLTATYSGEGGVLKVQSDKAALSKKRSVFVGCEAGRTFFHVDPLGRASICKIARNPQVRLDEDGVGRLVSIADDLLSRSDECKSCGVQSGCNTCPPMVADYRRASAPSEFFCQRP